MTLTGYDVAKYQLGKDPGGDFLLAKATQGIAELDPDYTIYKNTARNNKQLFGAYHYANGSDVNAEANWFTSQVGRIPGETIMLDIESTGVFAVNDPVGWCLQWLNMVAKITGVRGFIYLSASKASAYDWSRLSNSGYLLWLADYLSTGQRIQPAIPKGWPKYIAWQWGGNGIDTDIFYGSAQDWLTYGGMEDMNLSDGFKNTYLPGGPGTNVEQALAAGQAAYSQTVIILRTLAAMQAAETPAALAKALIPLLPAGSGVTQDMLNIAVATALSSVPVPAIS